MRREGFGRLQVHDEAEMKLSGTHDEDLGCCPLYVLGLGCVLVSNE